MKYYNVTFASTYGSCAYGSDQFNSSSVCSATTGSSGGTSSGGSAGGSSAGGILSNTGFDFMLVATVVCVVAFAALVLRFVRRPKQKSE